MFVFRLAVRLESGGASSEHHYPRLQPSLEITNSLHSPQSASSLNHSLEFFIKKYLPLSVKCTERGESEAMPLLDVAASQQSVSKLLPHARPPLRRRVGAVGDVSGRARSKQIRQAGPRFI